MKKRDFTARQLECFEFIIEHFVAFWRAPTIREIGAKMRISSTNGVCDHLRALARKGAITRQEGQSRAIEVNWDMAKAFGLPYPIWKNLKEEKRHAESQKEMPEKGMRGHLRGLPIAA